MIDEQLFWNPGTVPSADLITVSFFPFKEKICAVTVIELRVMM